MKLLVASRTVAICGHCNTAWVPYSHGIDDCHVYDGFRRRRFDRGLVAMTDPDVVATPAVVWLLWADTGDLST